MNVEALKALYVALGGSLADTYESIADGAAVGNYSLICNVISAIAQIAGTHSWDAGTMVVRMTRGESGYVSDKTSTEVYNALANTKAVQFIAENIYGATTIRVPYQAFYSSSDEFYEFAVVYPGAVSATVEMKQSLMSGAENEPIFAALEVFD